MLTFKGAFIDLGMAAVFAMVALLMLGEFRVLLKSDPRAALSVGTLKRIVLTSGVTGYLGAFFLAVSILCVCAGAITLLMNIAPLLNLLE